MTNLLNGQIWRQKNKGDFYASYVKSFIQSEATILHMNYLPNLNTILTLCRHPLTFGAENIKHIFQFSSLFGKTVRCQALTSRCISPQVRLTYDLSTLAYLRQTDKIIIKKSTGFSSTIFVKSTYTVKNTYFWREINNEEIFKNAKQK